MAKIPDITVKVDVIEVSALQQLAKEFRRLAAEAKDRSRRHLAREDETAHWIAIGKDQAFAKAAQMLEEKLS